MNARILIVGAGAIGARHLQGVARVAKLLYVDVVDPSGAARQRAADLLVESGGLQQGTVTFHADLSRMETPDIAIVATNARERPQVICDLVQRGVRRFLLEKVLFTRISDYEAIGRVLEESGAVAWVNCVRRAYPRSSALIDMIGDQPFSYCVEGEGWGLGCNLIHHLDEFALLSGRPDIRLHADALAPVAIPAKRAGYLEFLGTITGTLDGNRAFTATCGQGAPGDRIVTIRFGEFELRISQQDQAVSIAHGKSMQSEPFPIPLQSEATADHVNAMLAGRAPALVDYATAATLHCAMLSAFLAHLRHLKNDPSIEECPIT